MNGSPITSWEGAEAYFTFADSPGVLALILVIAVAVTAGAVASAWRHENQVYKTFGKGE